jgi:hypothetical protein
VARIAMGWPLAALGALVTYLAIRSAQRAIHAERVEAPADESAAAASAEESADVPARD